MNTFTYAVLDLNANPTALASGYSPADVIEGLINSYEMGTLNGLEFKGPKDANGNAYPSREENANLVAALDRAARDYEMVEFTYGNATLYALALDVTPIAVAPSPSPSAPLDSVPLTRVFSKPENFTKEDITAALENNGYLDNAIIGAPSLVSASKPGDPAARYTYAVAYKDSGSADGIATGTIYVTFRNGFYYGDF